ncbi:MAG: hypothetical protein ACYCU0_04500 [Solirubrobacteraceae bacterium]
MDPEPAATMAACLAREIVDGDVVGIGLGTPLALAAALLAMRTHAPGAHLFSGGMVVRPGADVLAVTRGPQALGKLCSGFVTHMETMEMAERRRMTLQFLRPAQVDAAGNLNTSRVRADDGGLRRLPGGLATADVPRILPRIVVYHTDHRISSLPQHVSFLTGAGGGDPVSGAAGPVRLITDRAVFSFSRGQARLDSVHRGQSVEEVLSRTGFSCDASAAAETEPPSGDELEALAEVDGLGLRELELRAGRVEATARMQAALARLEHEAEGDPARAGARGQGRST